MEALTCEICGGKLVGKAGGTFECESCGMSFDKKRIIELVHEIKGTVKVEKTLRVEQNVNVRGTVKVEGGLNAENYVKRGNIALQDRKWEEAKGHFHQALDYDPENGDAYLGLTMAILKQPSERTMERFIESHGYCGMSEYRNAKKYSKRIADKFSAIETAHRKRMADAAAQKQAREEEEARKRKEENLVLENKYSAHASKYNRCGGMISACKDFSVGVCSDGTVLPTPGKRLGAANLENWNEMVAVAADDWYVVGLRANGTVRVNQSESLGHNFDYVRRWTDVIAISTGDHVTAGLKSDGTVYLDSEDMSVRNTVQSWKDIRAVSVGVYGHVLGLKSDGTVLAVGENKHGECNVSGWKNIIAISAGQLCSAALDAEGKVHYTGLYTIKDHEKWTDIVSVAAGCSHLIGLRSDGRVVAAGKSEYGACDVSGWRDIVAVTTTKHHTVGLRADGTVVATKFITDGIYTDEGQSDVSDWRLFQSLETLDSERETGFAEVWVEMRRRQAQLNSELTQLRGELPNLKGLFSGKRRKKVENRICEIEEALKGF